MTTKELKILAVLIVDEQERRVSARALQTTTKEIKCRTKQEEEFASTKTKKQGSGGWKSPAAMADELLNR